MKCLSVLFFVAALCATGDALKCYSCSPSGSCDDPFDKKAPGVQEIEFGRGCFCTKSVVHHNGKTLTERSCMSINSYSRASESLNGAVNFCSTDLCNGATATQIASMLLAAPLIFLLWH